MIYKNKNFYTASEHIKYLKEVEKLNDVEVATILREYWHCKNIEIGVMLDRYEKGKENGNK